MSKIILNKNLVPSRNPCIGHNDRGFTLGHGLFETILVKNGAIPALGYHWQRLKTSAEMIGISLPFTLPQLEEMIKEFCRQSAEKVAWEVIPDLAENLIRKEIKEISDSVKH